MAAFEERGGFCRDCNRNVIIKRKGTNHILHLLLTLVTFGLWALIWFGNAVKFGGWLCAVCGSKSVSTKRS